MYEHSLNVAFHSVPFEETVVARSKSAVLLRVLPLKSVRWLRLTYLPSVLMTHRYFVLHLNNRPSLSPLTRNSGKTVHVLKDERCDEKKSNRLWHGRRRDFLIWWTLGTELILNLFSLLTISRHFYKIGSKLLWIRQSTFLESGLRLISRSKTFFQRLHTYGCISVQSS